MHNNICDKICLISEFILLLKLSGWLASSNTDRMIIKNKYETIDDLMFFVHCCNQSERGVIIF